MSSEQKPTQPNPDSAIELPLAPESLIGFLDHEEGEALYRAVCEVSQLGPCLEIGSYCGKSTVYLGAACHSCGNTLFAVDHHRGSEEHQPGESYHDPELFDAEERLMDSFPEFRRTLRLAGLEHCVVPVVAPSSVVARHWRTPLALVFIDGGHSLETAQTDYRAWASQILPGGILAIHDIYPDPADGGQAPYQIWQLALASGLFTEQRRVKSLGLLRRR